MDQSIVSIFSGGGSLGLIALVLIEIYKLYINNKKTDQTDAIMNLQRRLIELEATIVSNNAKIETLETRVFELRNENAELRGLLTAQETKEELVKKYTKKAKAD
jgi:uncharacterized coiled-coil protein SlyX